MTKNEYISKYGLEAYNKVLEANRNYCRNNADKIRNRVKNYRNTNKEHYQLLKRLDKYRSYCKNYKAIENYDKAVKDSFIGWCVHHRLETHTSDGELRLVALDMAELIALDMYYNRPAEELVFMTKAEHNKLHNKFIHPRVYA